MASECEIHVKKELFASHLTPKRNPEPAPTPISIPTMIMRRRRGKEEEEAKDSNAVLLVWFVNPLPSELTPLPSPSLTNEQLPLASPSARTHAVADASAKQFY